MTNLLAVGCFWIAVALDALRDSVQDVSFNTNAPRRPKWVWTAEWWHTGIKPGEMVAWILTGVLLSKAEFQWALYLGAVLIGMTVWNVLYSWNRYHEPFHPTNVFLPGLAGDRPCKWDSIDAFRFALVTVGAGMIFILLNFAL